MDYEGFGIKCIGQSHLEKNTVCQDSVQYIQSLKYTVVSVSDGHGGQKYFRSDIGSEHASLIGCEKISEFLMKSNYSFLNEKEKIAAIDQLIDSIVTEWNIAIRDHIAHFPFKESELVFVDDKDLDEYKKHTVKEKDCISSKEPYSAIFKAYGATLICVGVNKEFGIGLQIGDGKCVAMYEDCSMDEPIPWDEKCHLNKCTSICDKDAVSEFRVYVWEDRMPMCIYIASDGIDDTFSDRLHSFYRSLTLDLIEPEFRNNVEKLEKKLPSISKNGSQDDVSIAGIINVKLARRHKEDIIKVLNKEQLEYQLSAAEKELEKLLFKMNNTEKMIAYEATDERLSKKKDLERMINAAEDNIVSIKKQLGLIPDDTLDEKVSADDGTEDTETVSEAADAPECEVSTDDDTEDTVWDE